MLVFWGEGKPKYPEKTSRCREKNQQTQPTFWHRIWESNPGHFGGRGVPTAAPSLHPRGDDTVITTITMICKGENDDDNDEGR